MANRNSLGGADRRGITKPCLELALLHEWPDCESFPCSRQTSTPPGGGHAGRGAAVGEGGRDAELREPTAEVLGAWPPVQKLDAAPLRSWRGGGAAGAPPSDRWRTGFSPSRRVAWLEHPDAWKASVLASAAAVSVVQGCAFLPRGMMAQHRVRRWRRGMCGCRELRRRPPRLATSDLLVGRHLGQRFRRHRRVAGIAAGERCGPEVQRPLVGK
jgi:hypothetical protein